MKKASIILPLAALIALASPTFATAQDETPGTVVTYTVDPSLCGTGVGENQGFPVINCFNLSFSDGNGNPAGSTWIYTNIHYLNGWQPYGWGHFFGLTDLVGPQETVTSSSMTVDPNTFNLNNLPPFPTGPPICNNNCTVFTANITGTTPDDGSTYTAVLTANLFFYKGYNGGRGGGWRKIAYATGGSIVVTYN